VPDRPLILLDCDPGHDDAVAIALAHRHAELVGITTVGGNSGLANTTRNALRVCALLGIDVPVHAGSDQPLVAPTARRAERVHGTTGLDGAELPEPRREADSDDAAGFIVEMARAHEGLWLVPTGPQTNIALALERDPDLPRRVAGVSFMGGSAGIGNTTSHAEFNIAADPEAAEVVLTAGFRRVTMAGLDVTAHVRPTPAILERLRATGAVGAVYADLLRFYLRRCEAIYVDAGASVHDALAVLWLTHAELFGGRDLSVAIETTGTFTRGMTVVDQRPLREPPAPNCHVLFDVDAAAVWDVIADALASYPETSG
jgi:inosine-uridine nucleoside N-ribohydrolase